jgi:hypothetical protein
MTSSCGSPIIPRFRSRTPSNRSRGVRHVKTRDSCRVRFTNGAKYDVLLPGDTLLLPEMPLFLKDSAGLTP